MKNRLLERSAAVVWVVIAALFVVILIFHLRELGEHYAHIDVGLRPGEPSASAVAPNPNAGFQIVIGRNPDGTVTRQSFANGIALDAPLRSFAAQFNGHIDELNRQRLADDRTAVMLDLIGAITAAFSGLYELLKSRHPAAP